MTEQPAQPANPQPMGATRTSALQAASEDPGKRLEELERLAGLVAYHDDQSKQHADASKAAKHAIMLLHQQRGKTVELEDGTKITWKTPSRSFDSALFQAAYPPEANAYMYETKQVLDPEAIPPKLKAAYMQPGPGDGSIVIK